MSGRVYVRFIVDRKGHVGNVAVVRTLHPAADAEAIRVANLLSGHFLPGTNKKRQPIDVGYTLPFFFHP
ncbi:energy transducer TonB [Hymenobacter sp. UYP22]|uniref:energy transducer TonB n=1 Tax=Hymenobacter sp. UYP22 TaxID=3156348 RepID=UPI003394398D